MDIDIFELRFTANLDFFQNKETIAKELEKLFDYWEVDSTTIKLANNAKNYSVILECKRIAFSSLNLKQEEVSNLFNRIIETYKKYVEIKKVERIGYKKTSTDKLEMSLSEANKLISDKLYANKKDIEKLLGKISNLALVIDSEEEDYFFHHRDGAMETDQARENMWGLIPKTIKESSFPIFEKMPKKSTYFFSDIDCFKVNQKLEIYKDFPSFVKKVTLLKKDIKKYLIR